MLVTDPGMYSLNLFSGKPAPDASPWILFLNDSEQAAVVRQIQAEPVPCAVTSPEIAKIYTGGRPPPDTPLVRYLREDFRIEFETGIYRFMVRK